MGAGRPTDYKPEYCQIVIEYMGEQGKSLVQLARKLEVCKATIYNWSKEHPEFLDALTRAQEWAEAHWEERFTEFMVDRNANAPLIKLYMANRFRWSERSAEPESDSGVSPLTITIERKNARKPEQPAG